MGRRRFTREFKLEVVKLAKERGVAALWDQEPGGGATLLPCDLEGLDP
jgi:hypothetical protein